MELQELGSIVSDWYRFGRITPANRERVKRVAFQVGAADPEGCKTCPNFWNNVMHNLISYLRTNNYKIMSSVGKYKLADGTGSLSIPFQSKQLIAEGENTDNLLLVSDPDNLPFIESVLEQFPEISEYLQLNPAYKEPEKKEEKETKGKSQESK